MYKDTNTRSVVKGVSWRVLATTTTIIIVYVFFGRLDLAIAAGMLETVAKVGLYWAHERAWFKIKWGKKRIIPFNLWLTGLPLSGKTIIANKVFDELKKMHIPVERLDSENIDDVIPRLADTKEERINHMYRIGNFIKTLQNNSVSTVASFVSPYRDSRFAIREKVKNNIIVYVKAAKETCEKKEFEKHSTEDFEKMNNIYEEPQMAELILEMDNHSIDEAVEYIIKYLKKNYIN